MAMFKLLTVGNPKTAKGAAFGYLTGILHLAPAKLSGFEVCPNATDGCRAACLNTAGRGGIAKGGLLTYDAVKAGRRNTIQAARIRKTRWYFEDRPAFMVALAAEIEKLCRVTREHGLKPAVRLNGTSDIPWERVPVTSKGFTFTSIMAMFVDVQFYDYTKRANRRNLPDNYTLTFSLADGNDKDANAALNNGMNVAAVFHKVPDSYTLLGLPVPVIDGDQHDLRFLDPRGVIVGLKAKGNAKRDTSGFVR